MNKILDQKRIKSLYQMLFEMATGNLSFRLDDGGNNDELEELESGLNRLASKFSKVLQLAGYVNPHYSYQSLVQVSFILNDDFLIESSSPDVVNILGFPNNELFKMDFDQIIATQSMPIWKRLKEEAYLNDAFQETVQIIFMAKDTKLIPSFCTVTRLSFSKQLLISSITTILQALNSDSESKMIAPRPSDVELIQNVYEYILNNLEEPLPTLQQLSKIFGTNEFRLKDGFRHFFNTSIYQFYNEERLKRAHLLIIQTSLPLKSIAFMSGFNDYTNFSKAFKKRYSYSPSDLKRENEDMQ